MFCTQNIQCKHFHANSSPHLRLPDSSMSDAYASNAYLPGCPGILLFGYLSHLDLSHPRLSPAASISYPLLPGNLQTSQSPIPSYHTNMTQIEEAIAEIELLRPIDSICYTTVAKKHDFWHSTSTLRYQATTVSSVSKSIGQRRLDEQVALFAIVPVRFLVAGPLFDKINGIVTTALFLFNHRW